MKSNTLIIICMVLLIFLGIVWLKFNSGLKEGLDTAALSADILNTVNTKLVDAGVDVGSFSAAIPGTIDQITTLMTQGLEAGIGTTTGVGMTGQGPPDLSGVLDTTGSDLYPYKSFLTGNKFSDGFCKSYTNPVELNQKCGALTTESCNQTDCCVVLNGSKCVAGNAQGPTFQVDESGKDIDYAYYSYKNECFGSCGKGLANAANPCAAYAANDANVSEACIKRLWSQSGCKNPAYITPAIVASLKDYSKTAIQVQFKKALTDEPNFEKCYGYNEDRWPAPCTGTTDTSYGLSARCLNKLLTDAGCTNQAMIDDAYVLANKLEPKSAMINKFSQMATATDDDQGLLTKCYGANELQWPDACANTTNSANILDGTLPKRCAYKLFTDATTCPSKDTVNALYAEVAAMSMNDKNALIKDPVKANKYSKVGLTTQFTADKNKIQSNRFQCYGINPNKWPDSMGVNKLPEEVDPCYTLTPSMSVSDVSPSCKTRLQAADIFPTTACDSNRKKTEITAKVALDMNSGKGSIYPVLTGVEDVYQTNMGKRCGPVKEYIFGVGGDNQVYSKPTDNLAEPWALRSDPATDGNYRTTIQLNDKTFLSTGLNYNFYTHKTIPTDKENPMTIVPLDPCCVVSAVQLNNGTIIVCGTDGYLYHRASLSASWAQIPNSSWVRSITLINGGTQIAGCGGNWYVYVRSATTSQSPWTLVPNTNMTRSITQLKDGTFIGVGYYGELFRRANLNVDDTSTGWSKIPNSGTVTYISTVNVQ